VEAVAPTKLEEALAQVAREYSSHTGCTDEEAWDDICKIESDMKTAGLTIALRSASPPPNPARRRSPPMPTAPQIEAAALFYDHACKIVEAAEAAAWRPIAELPDIDEHCLFISDDEGHIDYCAPQYRRTDATRWRLVRVPNA
jgi:hypothetical protein